MNKFFQKGQQGAFATSEEDLELLSAPVPQMPTAPPSQQIQSVVQQAFDEQIREVEMLDEAQKRFRRAEALNEIIGMNLFDDNREAEFYEIEEEVREFARKRMHVYLGIQPDDGKVATKTEKVKLPFTQPQIEVLTAWADSLISRPKLLAAPRMRLDQQEPQQGRPTSQPAPVATPQQMEQRPAPPQVQAVPQRRRGRPPGTGKNQRAAAMQQSQQPQQQATGSQASPQVTPVQNIPAGAMVDDDGIPYIMHEIIVDGKPKLAKSRLTDQAKPIGAQPQPWPSGHSPLDQSNTVNAFRVSQGFNNGNAAAPISGPLADAVRFFQQGK